MCIFLCALSNFSIAQNATVSGYVTDEAGTELPFANVFVIDVSKGSSTNYDGFYQINLSPGSHTIRAQYVGYESQTRSIQLEPGQQLELNFSLLKSSFKLSEVVVKDDRNPADEIMRAVIAKRPEHYERSKVREVDVYIKGQIRLKDAPTKFMGVETGGLDSILLGMPSDIIYLSETKSLYTSTKNWDREKVYRSKTSGFQGLPSINQAALLEINWYKNNPELLNTVIKSPLADDGFSHYRYKLLGVQKNSNDKEIYLIGIEPKRKEDPLVSGTIQVVQDEWKLISCRLAIDDDRLNNEFVDSCIIDQIFLLGEGHEIWPVIQTEVDLKLSAFNFQFNGNFTAVYSNILTDPDLFTQTNDKVALAYDEKAFEQDSGYWERIRPIPLDSSEILDYAYKDSLFLEFNDSTRLDSLERAANIFTPMNLISGYTYNKSSKGTRINITSPLTNIFFNPVQGFHSILGVNYDQLFDSEKLTPALSLSANVNYGFSDRKWRYLFNGRYTTNFKAPLTYGLAFGDRLDQINNTDPISESANGFNNLFFKNHYIRFYRSRFAKASLFKRWDNGWESNWNLMYEHRNNVENTTNYSIFLEDEPYPENRPDHIVLEEQPELLRTNDIVKLEGRLVWKPGIRYMDLPNQRIEINSSDWIASVDYKIGVVDQNWSAPFAWIAANLYHQRRFGILGQSSWYAEAGSFINNGPPTFYDYTHFNGNRFWLGDAEYTKEFQLLPYYRFSTDNPFFQFHWTHNFKSYLLNKIPGIRNLDFALVAKASYLTHQDVGHYNEFSIGVDRLGWGLLRLFRVDFTLSYRNGQYFDWGLLFGSRINLADITNRVDI